MRINDFLSNYPSIHFETFMVSEITFVAYHGYARPSPFTLSIIDKENSDINRKYLHFTEKIDQSDKILSVRRKEVHEHALLQADAAMLYAVGF